MAPDRLEQMFSLLVAVFSITLVGVCHVAGGHSFSVHVVCVIPLYRNVLSTVTN